MCVSVTLSVNSPTGQTAQRIFTVDSLKDADICKDVPFGGLDHEVTFKLNFWPAGAVAMGTNSKGPQHWSASKGLADVAPLGLPFTF